MNVEYENAVGVFLKYCHQKYICRWKEKSNYFPEIINFGLI